MSEQFKPGDRVKVEFEGTVESIYDNGEDTIVANAEGERYRVSPDVCTLIEPEIVLPEVPGTIVQVDPLNEHDERVAFEYDSLTGGGWWRAGYLGSCTTDGVVGMCREFGYRVIPAAEAEGVSE